MSGAEKDVSLWVWLLLAAIGALSITNVVAAVSFHRVKKEVEKICAKAKENLDQAKTLSRRNSAFREALEKLARRRKDI